MPRVWPTQSHWCGLPIRRPRTWHLPIGRLGRHLPQDLPVGTLEETICDLLPVAAATASQTPVHP